MTQPRGSGPDPIGDFQRWLIKSGARGMTRELGGHIAGAFGLGGKPADVWQSATAPPPQEAPECAWCPVCRAARLLRESGPGLASHVASASETLASLVGEAASVVESALAAAGRRPEPGAGGSGPQHGWDAAGDAAWEEAAAEAESRPAADADADPAASVWAEATGNGAGPSVNGNGSTGSGPAAGRRPRQPDA